MRCICFACGGTAFCTEACGGAKSCRRLLGAVGHRSPVEVLTGSDQGLYQMAGMCSLENLNPGKETP